MAGELYTTLRASVHSMNSVFDGGVELSAKINCDDNLSPT
jgi:hypothetical protein